MVNYYWNLSVGSICRHKLIPMDKNTTMTLGLSSATFSSKKQPFSPAERELIVDLVKERPIIEDKCTNAKNRELKRLAWDDLASVYNSQPYVTQRLSTQLKRCWENIKTLRKKELSQESLKRSGGGPPEIGFTEVDSNSVESFDDTESYFGKNPESQDLNKVGKDKQYFNKEVDLDIEIEYEPNKKILKREPAEVYDSPNNSEDVEYESEKTSNEPNRKTLKRKLYVTPNNFEGIFINENGQEPTAKGNNKFMSEAGASIKRQQDQELHDLRVQREKILIKRERQQLQFEEEMHKLQVEKIKLEIDMLSRNKEN